MDLGASHELGTESLRVLHNTLVKFHMLAAPTQHIYDLTTPRATHLKYETY